MAAIVNPNPTADRPVVVRRDPAEQLADAFLAAVTALHYGDERDEGRIRSELVTSIRTALRSYR